jgi:RNA polymerase sigma-70 factor (ECF subfamily)
MILFNEERKMQMLTGRYFALVAAALEDPAVFGRLYDHYVQPIYRYIYSRTYSAYEAEDITSQTFITAYESLPKYRERGHFSAWLFRIAQSKMNDHFRRSRREVVGSGGAIVEKEDALGTHPE